MAVGFVKFARSCALLLMLLASFATAASAESNVEKAARALFLQGVSASRSELWLEARMLFKQSLKLAPRASTYFNLAVVDVELGLTAEARSALSHFEAEATAEHADLVELTPALLEKIAALGPHDPAEEAAAVLVSDLADLSPEARRETTLALKAHANRDDHAALAALERAHEQSQRGEFLYSIGLLSERLGDEPRALAAYGAFVLARPDTPEALAAGIRIRALRGHDILGTMPVPPSAVDEASLTPESRRGRMLMAFSAVAALGALGTGLWAHDRAGWLAYCDRQDSAGRPCRPEDEHTTRAQYRAGLAATAALSASALALAVSGAVRVRQSRRAARPSRAALDLGPNSVAARFLLLF